MDDHTGLLHGEVIVRQDWGEAKDGKKMADYGTRKKSIPIEFAV
jgi:hypothetical protein